jgi:hypothetical protein
MLVAMVQGKKLRIGSEGAEEAGSGPEEVKYFFLHCPLEKIICCVTILI